MGGRRIPPTTTSTGPHPQLPYGARRHAPESAASPESVDKFDQSGLLISYAVYSWYNNATAILYCSTRESGSSASLVDPTQCTLQGCSIGSRRSGSAANRRNPEGGI